MRCEVCSYELWNLHEPRCPECGHAFDLSDWEFDVRFVEFQCPHCSMPLPDRPAKQECMCVRCGQRFWGGHVPVSRKVDGSGKAVSRLRAGRSPRAIAWSRRRVRPMFSWGWFCFTLLCVFAAAALLPAGSRGLKEPNVGRLALPFLFGLTFAFIGVLLANWRARRTNVIVWGWLLVLWMTPITWKEWRRCQSYATVRSLVLLRGLHQVILVATDERGSTWPSLALLVPQCSVSLELLFVHPSEADRTKITFGPWTLADFEDGKVTYAQLEEAVAKLPVSSEWERVGDFVLSRLSPQHGSVNSGLIVGVSPVNPWTGERAVVRADNSWAVVPASGSWIERQNALRASLNLEPLPALP